MKDKMIKFLTAYNLLTKEQQREVYIVIANDNFNEDSSTPAILCFMLYDQEFGQ